MSSTYKQRYLGTEKESRVKYQFTGQLRLIQVCLDYEGTESPLSCTVDGDNVREIVAKSGATDIVSLYDNGSTPLYPTKENVINEFVSMCGRCQAGDFIAFQFSGHGTHEDDEDGDESDGQD